VVARPTTVIGQEFDLAGAERVVIYGSWAARYHGAPGMPPNDVGPLVVGAVEPADVYDAADRAEVRLGMQTAAREQFFASPGETPRSLSNADLWKHSQSRAVSVGIRLSHR
jgi:hypothetical protein